MRVSVLNEITKNINKLFNKIEKEVLIYLNQICWFEDLLFK
jgi:hypothetical protein